MKAENGGKQMKDVWTTSLTPPSEKTEGRHPTQKPLFILERIIKASSNAGDVGPILRIFDDGRGSTKIRKKIYWH